MAESEMGGERTEEPSQRRLQEARERGQIPRSRELTNFATMIGGSAALVAIGGTVAAHLAHKTLMVTSLISAPLLLIALITGLAIGMLQAATQINESTLSFIPKLLMLVLTLFVAGPWILRVLIDFTRDLYANIPAMIG